MLRKLIALAVLAAAFVAAGGESADAAIYYRRVAPVRRVAARAVLPPYPVARRAVVGPVYRGPVYRPYYGPGVGIYVGW